LLRAVVWNLLGVSLFCSFEFLSSGALTCWFVRCLTKQRDVGCIHTTRGLVTLHPW
jgi:hypothetical protein